MYFNWKWNPLPCVILTQAELDWKSLYIYQCWKLGEICSRSTGRKGLESCPPSPKVVCSKPLFSLKILWKVVRPLGRERWKVVRPEQKLPVMGGRMGTNFHHCKQANLINPWYSNDKRKHDNWIWAYRKF